MRNKKQKENTKAIKSIETSILSDVPRITLCDNKELTVENYKGIFSYGTDEITLGSKNNTIKITGDNLLIKVITDEEISVSGEIFSVSFTAKQ